MIRVLINTLNRTSEYWDGLANRLGFDPRIEEQTYLVHAAGVSFRQDLLAQAKKLCTFDRSPPLRLEAEVDNPYDRRIETPTGALGGAVKIVIGVACDTLTGEYAMEHVGYVPKNYCPHCACSLSGKQASKLMCPKCDNEQLLDIKEQVISRLLNGKTIAGGVDNITESLSGVGNRGLDIWLKLD